MDNTECIWVEWLRKTFSCCDCRLNLFNDCRLDLFNDWSGCDFYWLSESNDWLDLFNRLDFFNDCRLNLFNDWSGCDYYWLSQSCNTDYFILSICFYFFASTLSQYSNSLFWLFSSFFLLYSLYLSSILWSLLNFDLCICGSNSAVFGLSFGSYLSDCIRCQWYFCNTWY